MRYKALPCDVWHIRWVNTDDIKTLKASFLPSMLCAHQVWKVDLPGQQSHWTLTAATFPTACDFLKTIALCISRNQTAPNLHGHFLRCFLNRQFQYPSVYYIYDTHKWAVWTDSLVLSQNPKFLMILHEDYYILKTFSYRLTVTKGWKNTRSNIPQLLAWHREIPQPTTGKTPAWVPCPHSTGKPKTFWDFQWRRGNYG